METIEKIERYLEGQMTAEEHAAFEGEINQDGNLREEVNTFKDIIGGIRLNGEKDFMRMVHHWEKEIIASEMVKENSTQSTNQDAKTIPLSTSKKSGLRWIIRIALAACVVLLVGIGYKQLFNTINPEQAYQEAFFPYDPSLISRDAEKTDLSRAMAYYNSQDYAKAYPLLKQEIEKRPNETILKLYAGISAMQSNNNAAANQLLEEVHHSGNPNFEAPAGWYIALLKLKTGEVHQSKHLLSDIRNQTGHPYRENAKKLLRKLK